MTFRSVVWLSARLQGRITVHARLHARVATLLVLLTTANTSIVDAATPIGTVDLTTGWVTFGQVVPQGAAHDGLQVGPFSTQTDVKNRWPDGSIRFAVVTLHATEAGSFAIDAGAAPGAALVPALPTASVRFTIAGVVYTAELPVAMSSDRWLSGPLVNEGRFVVAPEAGGVGHPFLRAIFDARVYNDGAGRLDITVENVLDQIGATTVTYDVEVVVNGVAVWSKASVEHYYLTRYRKVFNIGGGFGSVVPDLLPFHSSGALPPVRSDVANLVNVASGPEYDILGAGSLSPDMSAHGGRPELAPIPDWTARYLAHKDPQQRAFVLASGDLSGSWPIHAREPEGGPYSGVGAERYLSLDRRPLLWYDLRAQGEFMEDGVRLPDGSIASSTPLDFVKGSPLPMKEYSSGVPAAGQSPLTPDNAHQPSLAYVPYLLTGDRYYADEMTFWANYGILRTAPSDGERGAHGILEYNEVRGFGWALRNIVDAAAYSPDAAVVSYLSDKVNANLQWLDNYANSQNTATNPLQVLWVDPKGTQPQAFHGARAEGLGEAGYSSVWEQTYLAHAIDRANRQGFSGGLAHRDAIARFQLRLFTSEPDYPLESPIGTTWGAPYLVAVGTVLDPNRTSWDGFTYYTTMAEIFAATSADPTLRYGDPCLYGSGRCFAGYYGPEARLNLMIGIESGWPGAQGAYDYLWPFIGVTSSYCAADGSSDKTDVGCRAGWALDFYPAVVSPDHPPTIVSPGDQTFAEGAVVSLPIDASDPDGDPVVLSASGLPGTLAVNGLTIEGTLSYSDAGVYHVSLTATANGQHASAEFTLTVTNTNRAPVVDHIDDQSGAVGDTVSLQVNATDPDGDALTYSAENLPAGLSIDPTTGAITGDLLAVGTHHVTVRASDGDLSGSASFTWTVTKPRLVAALVNPGPQDNTEGDRVSLRIKVELTRFGASLNPRRLERLLRRAGSFSAVNLPPGLRIGKRSGRIHGHLGHHSAGEYDVVVTFTEGDHQVSAAFHWTVHDRNRPPRLRDLPSRSNAEGASVLVTIHAVDPDGDALTFSARGLPPGLGMAADGRITGTIAAGSAGDYRVTITVSDGRATDSSEFTWKVVKKKKGK